MRGDRCLFGNRRSGFMGDGGDRCLMRENRRSGFVDDEGRSAQKLNWYNVKKAMSI